MILYDLSPVSASCDSLLSSLRFCAIVERRPFDHKLAGLGGLGER